MNILSVNYLPRGERSSTKKLLKMVKSGTAENVQDLNLLEHIPEYFDAQRVNAYIHRHYLGEKLNASDEASLQQMENLATQVVESDVVILSTPMYNFSLPAMVKSWFDSVMLKDRTWTMGENGYEGLMTGRKALVLMSSGGIYEGPMAGWDHAMSLAKQSFTFMGFEDVRDVWLQGANLVPEQAEERLQEAEKKITAILKDWNLS